MTDPAAGGYLRSCFHLRDNLSMTGRRKERVGAADVVENLRARSSAPT